MLQSTEQVLQELLLERSRLVDLINNLETFLCTGDYTFLPKEQKQLLLEQRSAMKQYDEVLLKRILLFRDLLSNSIKVVEPIIAKPWRKEE